MCALTYWVCDVFSCGHGYCMACCRLVYWNDVASGFDYDITCLSSGRNDVDACLFDVLT